MNSDKPGTGTASPPRRLQRLRLPRRPVRIAIWLVMIVVLLGVNYWAAHKATEVQRVRIPYSPFFLAQVQAGNVAEITSMGTAIQGVFRVPTRPPNEGV